MEFILDAIAVGRKRRIIKIHHLNRIGRRFGASPCVVRLAIAGFVHRRQPENVSPRRWRGVGIKWCAKIFLRAAR